MPGSSYFLVSVTCLNFLINSIYTFLILISSHCFSLFFHANKTLAKNWQAAYKNLMEKCVILKLS
jgi:hypothetical protein